jgi:hypothetical protein
MVHNIGIMERIMATEIVVTAETVEYNLWREQAAELARMYCLDFTIEQSANPDIIFCTLTCASKPVYLGHWHEHYKRGIILKLIET